MTNDENEDDIIKKGRLSAKVKKVITENKEKNLINHKISTKKLIKKNIFKKKRHNYEMEENNQNISNPLSDKVFNKFINISVSFI